MKRVNNLYIKFLRNNIFLNLSNSKGKLLFKCSCGSLNRENQKNKLVAFVFLMKLVKKVIRLKNNKNINLILGGALNRSRINLIYNKLLSYGLTVVFIKIVDSIPHNGCRQKAKKIKQLRRRYLG
jgi:ribosomal protein S11